MTIFQIMVVCAVVLWVGIIAFTINILRGGKQSDVNTMKAVMNTDDDDLARNVLEIEEDKEQQEAIKKARKDG